MSLKSTFFWLFPRARDSVLRGYRKRMVSACIKLAKDAQDKEPKTPVASGSLIGSYSVIVNNKLEWVSPYRGGTPEPITAHRNTTDSSKEIVGTVLVGKSYAAIVHDPATGLKFKRPGAGPLFLSSKVEKYRELMEEIARGFKDAAGGVR